MTATLPPLQGWVPVLARPEGDTLVTELCRIGSRRFAEPFFGDSVAACMRLPFHSVFRQRVDIETLARWVDRHPGLPLGGFIFHMSRCGSTLLSLWLAAAPDHRVMSEPPPLDTVLRAHPAIDASTRTRWLQAMVGGLGQTTRDEERRLFVKFDSWHAHHLALILRAFPAVPWVFMVREPVEVMVSHLRQPGAQMVPGLLGAVAPGLDTAAAASLPREQYMARLLGGLCEAAERALCGLPGGMVLDYATLPGALDAAVSAHFDLRPDAPARQAMTEALRRDAKNTAFEFRPDRAAKQVEASHAVRAAAASWVEPAYHRLLALAAG